MFMVDTVAGRIVSDAEIKHEITSAHPYQAWLDKHLVRLENLADGRSPLAPNSGGTGSESPIASSSSGTEIESPPELGDLGSVRVVDRTSLVAQQMAFGYSFEELRMLITPMARDGVEATGSMGTDTPLAMLSDRPKLLYDYFQQLFAQVTNPRSILFVKKSLLLPKLRSARSGIYSNLSQKVVI